MATRTFIASASVVALVTLGAADRLLACGDKFLVPSRGTRFQRAPVRRPPAAILVFANPATLLPQTLANGGVDATLRKAGYQPTSVTSMDALSAALERGGWDLVVADMADYLAIESRRQGATPAILPVVHNPTRDALAAARRVNAHVVKAPAKGEVFLEAVDQMVLSRSR